MELLLSDYPPVKTSHLTFSKKFGFLLEEARVLDIAVGYVSEQSLIDLMDKIYKSGRLQCNLLIGMHYFDKFTANQYAVTKDIHEFLTENQLGQVRLSTCFPFHGKIYLFGYEENKILSLIGSSNLSNIVQDLAVRQYEVDIFLDQENINSDLKRFFDSLYNKSPDLLSKDIDIEKLIKHCDYMEGIDGVTRITDEKEIEKIKNSLVLENKINIPLKSSETAKQSNINVYFGAGRLNKSSGMTRNRFWYEVEVIIPKKITLHPHFPIISSADRLLSIVTDDGYKFLCKFSGQYNKNFRSHKDLTILGRWMKGRLEQSGALTMGEPVTQAVFHKYGRDSLELIPIRGREEWYLNFGV